MQDIEKRAKDLDEVRKIRILGSKEIDVDKWATESEVSRHVKSPYDWLIEIVEEYETPKVVKKVELPWTKTFGEFAFRPGEVTLYAGTNGGGKSLATGQIALGLIKQGQKVCIASFEMKPKRTILRMLRQFGRFNFDELSFDRAGQVGKLAVEFGEWAEGYLWLYDQQGSTSARQVIAMARYCAVKLGVQHIFIDSLMKCVSGEDAYNEQKDFVDQLCALARDHNVHIHLIHHVRKGSSEEAKPNKMDIKGSGSITDQVDNVFIWWRNKKKENDAQFGNADPLQPDAQLNCEKQRNGEFEEWYNLWYDRPSQQFVEINCGQPMTWERT
jgi:twinkle protein